VTSAAPDFEELQGRLRGLLITIADQLPAFTVGLIDEMIGANECGLALETMSEMLVESEGRIECDVVVATEQLVRLMRLDELNVDRLRPLVVEPPSAEDE
jgi:hypothetical protein